MHIVLATSLYPPDIEESALYIKELAKRLSKDNTVTIVTYGYLPEKVSGVNIIAVDKRKPLPLRLIAFTRALHRATANANVVYIQNGPSTELPFLLISSINKTPFVFGFSDKKALERTEISFFAKVLKKAVAMRAKTIVKDFPLKRPEILPFEHPVEDFFASYENSWNTHIKQISEIFHHVI